MVGDASSWLHSVVHKRLARLEAPEGCCCRQYLKQVGQGTELNNSRPAHKQCAFDFV